MTRAPTTLTTNVPVTVGSVVVDGDGRRRDHQEGLVAEHQEVAQHGADAAGRHAHSHVMRRPSPATAAAPAPSRHPPGDAGDDLARTNQISHAYSRSTAEAAAPAMSTVKAL